MDWLQNLKAKEWKLDLSNITLLMQRLNNPHNDFKSIHVAGSNGKGSVCAILSAILSQQYKVGLYTSPHLKKFNERIQINGQPIADEQLNSLIEEIKNIYDDETYFEVATALAFLYFSRQKVDYAVIEVGLGGRFDATNIIIPKVCAITNISLEHTKYLGDTIEQIAKEKAGIIKTNVPIVCSATGVAQQIIQNQARKCNAPIIHTKKAKKNNGTFSVNGHHNLTLSLKGNYQLENAATAITVLDQLQIPQEQIKKGLAHVKWPARFEFRDNILLDSAHNVGGMQTLKREILAIKKNYEKIIAVVGILSDKDAKTMVEMIASFSDQIIFCQPDSHRAIDPNQLREYTNIRSQIILNPLHAVKMAKKFANPSDLILVTGSIYTVGAI